MMSKKVMKSKEILKEVLQAKIKSPQEEKERGRAIQILIDEVVKQIRVWSSKHADVLEQLLEQKDQA